MTYQETLAAFVAEFGEAEAATIKAQVKQDVCSEDSARRYMADRLRHANLTDEDMHRIRTEAMAFVQRAHADGILENEPTEQDILRVIAMKKPRGAR